MGCTSYFSVHEKATTQMRVTLTNRLDGKRLEASERKTKEWKSQVKPLQKIINKTKKSYNSKFIKYQPESTPSQLKH